MCPSGTTLLPIDSCFNERRVYPRIVCLVSEACVDPRTVVSMRDTSISGLLFQCATRLLADFCFNARHVYWRTVVSVN